MIRQTRLDDAHAIADIYNHYIKNTRVTFEETLVTVSDINARILELESTGLPRVVAEHNGNVIGYAYATKWSGRCSYRYSVEITIYLDASVSKRGWGTQLYKVLFDELRSCGIHAVIGGISLPNEASVALHEKFGMEKVAHFKEVGFKFGQWVDVGYWQVVL